MLGNHSRPRIPLPKQWSKRVRSGVLHAISLAHYSLWAAQLGGGLQAEGFQQSRRHYAGFLPWPTNASASAPRMSVPAR